MGFSGGIQGILNHARWPHVAGPPIREVNPVPMVDLIPDIHDYRVSGDTWKELETRFTRICAALVRKTPGSSDTGAVERELMSKEDSDELDSGTEPESTFSAFDSQ